MPGTESLCLGRERATILLHSLRCGSASERQQKTAGSDSLGRDYDDILKKETKWQGKVAFQTKLCYFSMSATNHPYKTCFHRIEVHSFLVV
jgi:hypothetical protein